MLQLCCSCIYNVCMVWVKKRESHSVQSSSKSLRSTKTELRLCMFKKEDCGDKLDLQYEPVSKLSYFICFVTNLNVIQFKQLEKGFILSRFSLLCFCEYAIIYSTSQSVSWAISYALSQISMWYSSNSLKRDSSWVGFLCCAFASTQSFLLQWYQQYWLFPFIVAKRIQA